MAVAQPAVPYLKKTIIYFSYRIKAQKQLMTQIFPPSKLFPKALQFGTAPVVGRESNS